MSLCHSSVEKLRNMRNDITKKTNKKCHHYGIKTMHILLSIHAIDLFLNKNNNNINIHPIKSGPYKHF